MKQLSCAAKLYLTLVPLALMTLAVVLLMQASLKSNSTELVEALRVKELAVASLANLLQQDDATKAIIIDPLMMGQEPGIRKIAAYDHNQTVFTEMAELSRSAKLQSQIAELSQFDEHQLRPLDTQLLEVLAEGEAAAAKELYFTKYEPLRAQYEARLKAIGAEADQIALAAEAGMHAANSRSLWIISSALLAGGLVVAGIIAWVARQLNQRLKSVAGELQAQAQSTQTSIGLLQAGNRVVAEGASEQAAALEETSASLEEITSMIKRNAESASRANDIAQQTRTAADAGGMEM